jgi:hypothetical protein
VRDLADTVYEGAKRFRDKRVVDAKAQEPPRPPSKGDDVLSRLTFTRDELLKMEEWTKWKQGVDGLDRLLTFKAVIKSPTRTDISTSVQGLESLELLPDLELISIEAGDEALGFHADVKFDISKPTKSFYSVEGVDPQNVNGVVTTIEDKLGAKRTSYGFAHKNRYTALASVLASVAIAILIVRGLEVFLGSGQIFTFAAFILFVLLLSFMIFFIVFSTFSRLFRWMFPFFTYEEDKRRGRRKAVRGIFYTVLASLVGSAIWSLILQLL